MLWGCKECCTNGHNIVRLDRTLCSTLWGLTECCKVWQNVVECLNVFFKNPNNSISSAHVYYPQCVLRFIHSKRAFQQYNRHMVLKQFFISVWRINIARFLFIWMCIIINENYFCHAVQLITKMLCSVALPGSAQVVWKELCYRYVVPVFNEHIQMCVFHRNLSYNPTVVGSYWCKANSLQALQ